MKKTENPPAIEKRTHSGHTHSHAAPNTADGRRRVALAALLTFGFMFAEIVGGLVSGSLALLADAAHMLTDAGSLGLAWLGFKLAERPADEARSFGWARFKVLAAFVNGLALIVLAVWVIAEAVQRFFDPQPVLGSLLLGVACLGLVVNLIAFRILYGGDQHDLNMRGAVWHVAGDVLGSVAAIIAALIILQTGWSPIDPLLSVLVAAIVCLGGVRIIRQTGHILIEGVPANLSIKAIKADLTAKIGAIEAVEHVHAWALNETQTLMTMDVVPKAGVCTETLRRTIKQHLREVYRINHATIEVISESECGPTNPCK